MFYGFKVRGSGLYEKEGKMDNSKSKKIKIVFYLNEPNGKT